MDTSKSPEGEVFVAGVSVFSGRPDPTWPVPPEDARRLRAVWDSLGPHEGGPAPLPPVLGYRGCYLREQGGREWVAYRGVATLKSAGGAEARRDDGREFERQLLATAPEGSIPRPVLESEFR
jgi:hypothetical protein